MFKCFILIIFLLKKFKNSYCDLFSLFLGNILIIFLQYTYLNIFFIISLIPSIFFHSMILLHEVDIMHVYVDVYLIIIHFKKIFINRIKNKTNNK